MQLTSPRGISEVSLEPLVTVLVTAYNRERFLRSALESVMAQTLARDNFEVIVFKNFRLSEIEDYCESNGIAVVTAEGTMGHYLAEGIHRARGSIVAFLDDDDMWEPTRLKTVVQYFESHPEGVLYRNGVRYIDEKGDPIRYSRLIDNPKRNQPHARTCRSSDCSATGLQALLDSDIDFNLSTIAVRRSMIASHIAEFRALTSGPDTFVFSLAYLSGCEICSDGIPLTRYRVSSSNVSGGQTGPGKVSEIRRELKTLELVQSQLADAPDRSRSFMLSNYLTLLHREYDVIAHVFNTSSSRMPVIRALLALCRRPAVTNRLRRLSLAFGLLRILTSRSVATSLYFRIQPRGREPG